MNKKRGPWFVLKYPKDGPCVEWVYSFSSEVDAVDFMMLTQSEGKDFDWVLVRAFWADR